MDDEPLSGELTLNPDGSFTYVPELDFVGEDTFTYRTSDGQGESAAVRVTLTVTAAPKPDEHFQLSDGVLTVFGASGNDIIKITRTRRAYRVSAGFGTFKVADGGQVSRLVVHAGDGNDVIRLSWREPSKSAELHGEAGNDVIIGSSSSDLLLGGAGNDTLRGGSGNDILIGGVGSDQLFGGSATDLLLGSDLDEFTDADWSSLLADWQAAESVHELLDVGNSILHRLLDDTELDRLVGGPAADLFVRQANDVLRGRIELDVALM